MMCVHVCSCVHVFAWVCMFVCLYACVRMYLHVPVRVCVCVICVHICVQVLKAKSQCQIPSFISPCLLRQILPLLDLLSFHHQTKVASLWKIVCFQKFF